MTKGDKAMKRVLVGILAIGLVFGLVGCKSISEKIGEEIAGGIVGGDVEVDGEDVTIETEDGAVTVGGDTGEMPKDFPDDFPIDDDAVVDTSSNIIANGKVTYYIALTSSGEVNDLYDWYKAEFLSEGWEITNDFKMAVDGKDTAMLAVKKDDMEGTLSVDPADDGGTDIGVTLTADE
jgi:hypothetical protein